ncbi:bifunctional chorismate mutase/prephenate dehydrogenase [Thiotrichales bacterium 19S3-7]|nr:bifunctional chorismate mutase/prephenate dehydrogenase [Thiotrichales bacterium 19S3-7]MCF6801174.1 bifunctional chorismate mutase/prephenate dehydrogenase [Thiotrichales bacterium 19S3-11]
MKKLNQLKTNKSIAIIGGKGQMARMINRFLKPQKHLTIDLIDKNDRLSDDQYKKFDLVLISVPIALTNTVIKTIAKKISKNCILCDFTSIKLEPLKCMLNAHSGAVIGLHPMFGPTISETKNQVIIHTPGRNQLQYQWFLDLLEITGFQIETMDAKEHDQLMNFIQGVEHFSTFCLGSFLKEQSVDLKKLLKLASPVYQMELNILGRLFYQSAELYADIIASDKKRIALLEAYADHIKAIALSLKVGKRDEFIQRFNAIRNEMGEFCQTAYEKTDSTLVK